MIDELREWADTFNKKHCSREVEHQGDGITLCITFEMPNDNVWAQFQNISFACMLRNGWRLEIANGIRSMRSNIRAMQNRNT